MQGFFENGGRLCYFVRTSRSKQAVLTLKDRSALPGFDTLVLTAKTAGAAGSATTVTVADANIVNAVPAHRESVVLVAPGATSFTANVSAADAAKFFPGDTVLLASATNSERNVIDTIAGGVVTLKNALVNAYAAADTMRLADLEPGQTRVRLDDVANIEPATVLTITNGAATESVAVQAVNKTTKTVTVDPLQNTYAMAAADPAVTATSQEFGLTITAGATNEHYTNLSMDPRHSRYYATLLTQSALVTVTPAYPASPSRPPDNRPAVLAATNLAGGADENYAAIDANDYKASIDTLKKLDDVNILCVPDRFDADVQQYMIDHCTQMADRFAVLDPRPAAEPADILTQRGTVASDLGFGALYYPRIMIGNPDGPGRIAVPPSGHIAGLYARTDDNPGVHKAPANEQLRGALDLERPITAEEQGPLNEQQVNCVRLFKGAGWSCSAPARSRPTRRGATSAPGGCCCSSSSRWRGHAFRGLPAQPRRAVGGGEAHRRRVPHQGLEVGRARRRRAGGGVSRPGRRGAESAGPSGAGHLDHQGNGLPGAARRVRRVPDHPAARRAADQGVGRRRRTAGPQPTHGVAR